MNKKKLTNSDKQWINTYLLGVDAVMKDKAYNKARAYKYAQYFKRTYGNLTVKAFEDWLKK